MIFTEHISTLNNNQAKELDDPDDILGPKYVPIKIIKNTVVLTVFAFLSN